MRKQQQGSIVPAVSVFFTATAAAGFAIVDTLNGAGLHYGHGVLGGIALAALINFCIGE